MGGGKAGGFDVKPLTFDFLLRRRSARKQFVAQNFQRHLQGALSAELAFDFESSGSERDAKVFILLHATEKLNESKAS
jgi:hypothetical protein